MEKVRQVIENYPLAFSKTTNYSNLFINPNKNVLIKTQVKNKVLYES